MRSFVISCAAVCAAVCLAGVISVFPARAQAPAGSTQTKVAVINFQNAVLSTGEMQKVLRDLQIKFKPRQDALQKGQQELSDIQTQLQASQGKLSQAGDDRLEQRIPLVAEQPQVLHLHFIRLFLHRRDPREIGVRQQEVEP